jgi:hypothetical protein
MVKKNYRRGYDKEVECANFLRDHGYWVERFYASKGTFDVIAVGDNRLRLIQVKRSKQYRIDVKSIANHYREDLGRMQKVNDVSHPVKTFVELWVWYDYSKKPYWPGGWRTFLLYGGGLTETTGMG